VSDLKVKERVVLSMIEKIIPYLQIKYSISSHFVQSCIYAWKLVFVTIFILLSIAGCRTTSTLNLGNRTIASSEVQDVVRMHHTRIQSMKGEGRISVETPEIGQSGSFILTLQKPDSILINLRGPFGIKVGTALVTRTGFLFYNSLRIN